MDRLGAKGVAFSDVDEERWGNVTRFTLPGGSVIGLYQPKHPMALKRDQLTGPVSSTRKKSPPRAAPSPPSG